VGFGLSSHRSTVEGELGVANFLLNFFKEGGVSLWLVWLCGIQL